MSSTQLVDLFGNFPAALRILTPELADMDITAILHYISNGRVAVSAEVLQAALQERLGQQRQEQIMGIGFAQEYGARGFVKGRAEGEAKGAASIAGETLRRDHGHGGGS